MGPDDGVTATPSASGLLPTQLAGVQVFFDGVAAPLYYAQSQQVNVQAPFELANPTTQIRIVYHNQATWASTVAVQPAAPGIFHADGGDSAQALLLNQDGTYNSAANPAPRGSVVALWGTGGGAIAPAGITGGFTPLDSLAPLGQPCDRERGRRCRASNLSRGGADAVNRSVPGELRDSGPCGSRPERAVEPVDWNRNELQPAGRDDYCSEVRARRLT